MGKINNKEELGNELRTLGYSFYPFEISIPVEERQFPNKYNLYINSSQFGLEYIGTFFINEDIDGNILWFEIVNINNGLIHTCYDYNDMIDSLQKFNSEYKFPVYCLDPLLHKSFQLERLFNWYTKNVLGFSDQTGFRSSYSSGDSVNREVCLNNVYGEEMFTIELHIKNDEDEKGTICRPLNTSFALVSKDFNGIEDMIETINSIVGIDVLTAASKNINILQNIKSDIDMSQVNITELKGYTPEIKNAKELLKKALSEALALLD